MMPLLTELGSALDLILQICRAYGAPEARRSDRRYGLTKALFPRNVSFRRGD